MLRTYHEGEFYYAVQVVATPLGNRPEIRTYRCLGVGETCNGQQLRFREVDDHSYPPRTVSYDNPDAWLLTWLQVGVVLECWYETASSEVGYYDESPAWVESEADREQEARPAAILKAHIGSSDGVAWRPPLWEEAPDEGPLSAMLYVHRGASEADWQDAVPDDPRQERVVHVQLLGRRIRPRVLDALQQFPNLTSLSLTNTTVVGTALQDFLARRPLLQRLSLFDVNVTEAAIRAVARMPRLETLFLTRCNVTDASLALIARLPRLRTLIVTECPVTDLGGVELARCSGLQGLSLDTTLIGDQTLGALASCRGLEFLSIAGTSVTSAGVKGLARVLPRCRMQLAHFVVRASDD